VRRNWFLVVPVLFALAAACSEGRGEVREWRPEDHDHDQATESRQVPLASARLDAAGLDPTLIEIAWRQKCASCHGPQGRGDGPSGPMNAAPDLTRDDFLAKVKDEEIASVIKNGRGKMPPVELPDGVIDGLVRRIRAKGRPH
jgi:mono/diheme cytochrome c family protein